MNRSKFFCFFLLIASMIQTLAQNSNNQASISGTVKDADNKRLDAVTVHLQNTGYSTITDLNGNFVLEHIPAGEYILIGSQLGYTTVKNKIVVKNGDKIVRNITLPTASNTSLNEVVVMGKSRVQEINESAYNVVAVDAKALHNTTLDLAHALDRISGVKIRENAGLGSDTRVVLNGFTGKHVKIFMDGVPMEGFGSSFGLNNIPINIADRIEVYKGVVPIELGADALGGAINIVTKQTRNTYVDASYSYGSFNTHKSSINIGHTTKDGFTFNINAYQNYSDNDYKVKTNLLNVDENSPSVGTWSTEEYWFKRFHDKYHNEAIVAKVGFVNKPWATRLILSATLAQEKKDVQTGNFTRIVYGGIEREAKSFIPSLTYEKKNLLTDNLNFSTNVNYNKVANYNTDTLARQYNWAGEYRTKGTKGEGNYILDKQDEKSWFVTSNLTYSFADRHSLSANNVYSTFDRKTTDRGGNTGSSSATYMRRKNDKNITGLSYKFEPNSKWNLLAFAKHYRVSVTGPVEVSTSTSTTVYEEKKTSFDCTGYGLATTYYLTNSIQLKASAEKAYRLPSEMELFGDGMLETGTTSLKPENSKNLNLNISYSNVFNNIHSVYFDAGLIYRDTRDYIRRIIEQRRSDASYTNHGKMRNTGFDIEARYFYKKTLSIGGNMTMQNIRNREKYTTANKVDVSIFYNNRMPYMPYTFGNVEVGYNFHNFGHTGNSLAIGYNLRYIHEFPKSWSGEGGDILVEQQLSHDANVTYMIKNGRYNIALEAKNFTNELLYDNYALQKPGRSFSIKFRYFFMKGE